MNLQPLLVTLHRGVGMVITALHRANRHLSSGSEKTFTEDMVCTVVVLLFCYVCWNYSLLPLLQDNCRNTRERENITKKKEVYHLYIKLNCVDNGKSA